MTPEIRETKLMELLIKIVDSEEFPAAIRLEARELLTPWQRGDFLVGRVAKKCDHKTQEEYRVCNQCSQFATIARETKALLDARKIYLDHLLGDRSQLDSAQEKMNKALERLEASVRMATLSNLWES